ncbi:MAG: hypothetical protein ACKV2V_08990 [Blastocatellia bacterium]
MKTQFNLLLRQAMTTGCALALTVSGAVPGLAQGTQEKKPVKVIERPEDRVIFINGDGDGPPHLPAMPPMPAMPLTGPMWNSAIGFGDHTFEFLTTEMSFSNKVVKGAPYSGEIVNETIQTLADGNRIVRKTSSPVYRDGEGRTRREHSFAAVGPWASQGEAPKTIFINDPVGGVNFTLNPRDKSATKIQMPNLKAFTASPMLEKSNLSKEQREKIEKLMEEHKKAAAEGKGGESHGVFVVADGNAVKTTTMKEGGVVVMERREGIEPGKKVSGNVVFSGGATGGVHVFAAEGGDWMKNVKKESLGTQVIEGISCEGTKITHTIPAGQIGNERAIDVVSETWYSPELKTDVLRKTSDPRTGEVIYRLTSVNRIEPDKALFEIPADYTVKETNVRSTIRLREKE